MLSICNGIVIGVTNIIYAKIAEHSGIAFAITIYTTGTMYLD